MSMTSQLNVDIGTERRLALKETALHKHMTLKEYVIQLIDQDIQRQKQPKLAAFKEK